MFVRDEEQNIGRTIDSILDQTVKFDNVFIVDDCSVDDTVKIIEDKGLEPLKLMTRHPSFIGTRNLSIIANESIRAIYSQPCDFFAFSGGDIVLDVDYVEVILEKFHADPDLVAASGWIRGELFNENTPRGCCRFYRFSFWDEHIKAFPYCYAWESYPMYKALSLGYRIGAFRDAGMVTLRPTRIYKPAFGQCMRELGYYVPLAIGRCFLAMFDGEVATGLSMLYNYFSCNVEPYDPVLAAYIKSYQRKAFLRKSFAALRRLL